MTLRALVLAIASMLMLAPLARASDDAAGWSGGFLGWRADHYFDRSGEATFEELAGPDAAKFLPSNGRVANLGAARQRGEALWLRVPIPKLAGPAMSNWVLSFNESRARHVTLFVPDPSTGGIVTASWSFTQSARPGVPNTRFAAFELTADQLSEKVVYLRVETLSSMRANLWLTPASGFLSDYARQGLGFGALAGALVALTFYSLALGVATGEKALIALGGLAVSIAFYSLADAGFVETLLFPGAAVVSRAISFGGNFRDLCRGARILGLLPTGAPRVATRTKPCPGVGRVALLRCFGRGHRRRYGQRPPSARFRVDRRFLPGLACGYGGRDPVVRLASRPGLFRLLDARSGDWGDAIVARRVSVRALGFADRFGGILPGHHDFHVVLRDRDFAAGARQTRDGDFGIGGQ